MKINLYSSLTITLTLLLTIACKKEVDEKITASESQLPTIAEWLNSQTGEYDSLKLALNRSGLLSKLDGVGYYTLFAQKDNHTTYLAYYYPDLPIDYISNLPTNSLRLALKKNIFRHKINLSYSNKGAYYSTISNTAPDGRFQMCFMDYKLFDTIPRINKAIRVFEANIQASNGVIHVVDRYLASRSLFNFLLDDDSLSYMQQAVSRLRDISYYLENLAPNDKSVKTLLVPSNKAFREFLASDSSINTIYDIDSARLRNILEHHIIKGSNITRVEFVNGQLNSKNGEALTISTNDQISITSSGSATANITYYNIQGENGIMHIIDKVLIPK